MEGLMLTSENWEAGAMLSKKFKWEILDEKKCRIWGALLRKYRTPENKIIIKVPYGHVAFLHRHSLSAVYRRRSPIRMVSR